MSFHDWISIKIVECAAFRFTLDPHKLRLLSFFRRAALLADRFAFLLEGIKLVGIN